MAWYPLNAVVPAELCTARLWLRPLRATDAQRDYEAVMRSAAQLRRWSQTDWPADDYTVAENRAELERHEREHHARDAFTYTVLSPDGDDCLGCVYLSPLPPAARALCPDTDSAARVIFWVRSSDAADDLDAHLLAALRAWFASAWLFPCTVFVTSPQDTRQVVLLRVTGTEPQPFTLPDGRTFWGFVTNTTPT